MARVKQLLVNGQTRAVDADAQRTLLSVLRDELGLTGTKYGCGEGQCGACTVLIDGRPTKACLTAVSSAEGHQLITIEGLEEDGKLHPLQQAFLDVDAMQCGYCTSGMIISGAALLTRNSRPAREEIVRAMNGNICRCGTYERIVTAIERAADAMQRTEQ